MDLIHGYIEPTITSLVETHVQPPMKERIHHFPFICSQVEMKFDVGGTKRFHRLKSTFTSF